MSSKAEIVWDDTWPAIRLVGPGARAFLNGQTTADINRFQDGVIFGSCWLTATGRVRALLEIVLLEKWADVIVLAGDINDVAKGFERVIFPADNLEIELLDSIRRVQLLADIDLDRFKHVEWINHFCSINKSSFVDYPKASLQEVEMWRLKQGLPIGKGEINGENNPFELGIADLLSLEKGCYLGQETIAKLARKNIIKQKLKLWEADGNVRAGQALIIPPLIKESSQLAGTITSAIYDVASGKSYGLAMVKRKAFLEEELYLIDNFKCVRLRTTAELTSSSGL